MGIGEINAFPLRFWERLCGIGFPKNKAQTYVESLGLKLGNLSYISEISSPVATPNYAPRMEMAMSADAQYTPSTFIPGNIEISISIQANFEISR